MANPLVKAGIKLAVKGGKKLAKKIKTRTNSTNNANIGPVDKAIKKTKKIRDKHKLEHQIKYENYADQYDKPIGMSKKNFYPQKKLDASITKANNLLKKFSLKKIGK
tara:strand:- start:2706 stop:3026 length:321 start_codon:yes stop_codon:yes gene_type:complete